MMATLIVYSCWCLSVILCGLSLPVVVECAIFTTQTDAFSIYYAEKGVAANQHP